MSTKQVITFVTSDINKLTEARSILSDVVDIQWVELDLDEYQGSPETVATVKCRLAVEKLQRPVIIEDTSLCMNALGGMPGVYIKWFITAGVGGEGLHKMLSAYDDKSAYALSMLAFCRGVGEEVILFSGRTNGTIVAPRGPNMRHLWYSCFQPDGHTQTHADMSKAIQDIVSHRGHALRAMKLKLGDIL